MGRQLSLFAALGVVVGARVMTAQAPAPTLVDVGGHKLSVLVRGTAKPGVPTVVFENGLGATVATWNPVPSDIASLTKTVAYDRAGVGASEPGPEPRTVKQIVSELHTMLAKIAAAPPYVLVGHSYGGPIIHTFAAMFPTEVAGLVYVDPTDFMQTAADMQAIWDKAGMKDGRDVLLKWRTQAYVGAPAGILAQLREVDRADRGGYAEFREAGDPPSVPTVVLLAGKAEPLPPTMPFPGDYSRFSQAQLEQRVDHFSRLTLGIAKGTLVVTTRSSHFIHSTEPELVSWGIRNVLTAAATHPELQRFVGEYPLVPNFVITITRDGDKLFLQATGQPAFALSSESATIFTIPIVGAKIEFDTDAAGTVTGLVLVQNGGRQRAPKAK